MILFAGWYYLPSNQEVRGRDVCSYYAIKENKSCYCFGVNIIPKTFYPNGSSISHINKRGLDIDVTG